MSPRPRSARPPRRSHASSSPDVHDGSEPAMTSVTYQVTGLTCEHCVRAVTGELASLASVTAVTVDLVPGGRSAVTVTCDAPLTAAAVAAALDEAGDYRLA